MDVPVVNFGMPTLSRDTQRDVTRPDQVLQPLDLQQGAMCLLLQRREAEAGVATNRTSVSRHVKLSARREAEIGVATTSSSAQLRLRRSSPLSSPRDPAPIPTASLPTHPRPPHPSEVFDSCPRSLIPLYTRLLTERLGSAASASNTTAHESTAQVELCSLAVLRRLLRGEPG
jgi:hypothetical protein